MQFHNNKLINQNNCFLLVLYLFLLGYDILRSCAFCENL